MLLPEKFNGQRSLVGYIPRGRKELDMTEQLSTPLKTLDTNLKDGTGAGQGYANFGPNRTASEVRVSFTLLSG